MKKQRDAGIPVQDVEALRAEVEKASRRLGARLQPVDRDGLAQEATLRLLEYLNRHEEVEHLARSFCWKTTYSVLVDRHRRSQRRGEESLEEQAIETTIMQSVQIADPEINAGGAQVREAIRSCLARLKTDYRRAVTLRLIGYSIVQVAEALTCKPKQADNRVYRGLSQLRKCLSGKGIRP